MLTNTSYAKYSNEGGPPMKINASMALFGLLAALFSQPALAEPQSADSALAKISCSIYGEASEEPEHNKIASELYLSGVEDLFDFLEAVESGAVTAADLHSSIPIIVGWNLNGLTISRDFAAGSIVSKIVEESRDDYLKYNDSGVSEKYGERRPSELWPIEAENLFRQGNCSLLDQGHSITPREIWITE